MNTYCDNCNGSPAAPLKLEAIISTFVWFKTSKVEFNACVVCAENEYHLGQAKTGRLGWWGPASFFKTLITLIQNRKAIAEHRKVLPNLIRDSRTLERQKAHLTTDYPTVFTSLVAIGAVVTAIFFLINPIKPTVEVAKSVITPLIKTAVGDCITKLEDDISIVEVTPCTEPHSWQVYGITISQEKSFNETVLNAEAEDFCKQHAGNIDKELAFSMKADPTQMVIISNRELWETGFRPIACLVGGDKFQMGRSIVTH